MQSQNQVISQAMMVGCEVCLEEYREGELELHQEMCILRLMFRCCLCYEDYVSKEGLWNHLDLHEIADESKESHYQEIKVKDKLHQCALCNDQRAYLETSYAKHIADVHDGFIQRCSDCGEQFRSESPMNDHVLSHCQAAEHPLPCDINVMDEESVPSKVGGETFGGELYKPSQIKEYSNNAEEETNNRLNEQSHTNLNTTNDKEIEMPAIQSSDLNALLLQFACELCGKVFPTLHLVLNHMSSCVVKTSSDSELGQKNAVDEMNKSSLNQAPDTQRQGSCRGKMCELDRSHHHFLRYHKPIKCNLCGVTSEGLYKSSDHTVKTHAEIPKYNCAKCSRTLYRIEGYERHLDRCNPEAPTFGPSSAAATSNKCTRCGIEESSADNLTRHILLHHDPVACDFCGNTLPSLSEAHIHVKTEHKETEAKCPECSMQFVNADLLPGHVSYCATHKFPCGFCGKMCKDLVAAQYHVRCPASRGRMLNAEPSISDETSAQSSSSRSKCHYCGAEFSNFGYLSHHMRIHHKLTKCSICGVTVFGLSSVKHHKFKFHMKEGYGGLAPVHSCVFCDKRFTFQTNLQKHIKRLHSLPSGSSHVKRSKAQNQNSIRNTAQENNCSACKTTFSCIEDVLSHMEKCNSEKGYGSSASAGRKFISLSKVPENLEEQKQNPIEKTAQQMNASFASETSLATTEDVLNHMRSEAHNQNSIRKTAQENTCSACKTAFSCIDDVLSHMASCLQTAKEQETSQFSSAKIALLPGVKELQANRQITPQDEIVALEMDLKVEDAMMLQDQECHDLNEGNGTSFATSSVNVCPRVKLTTVNPWAAQWETFLQNREHGRVLRCNATCKGKNCYSFLSE